MKNALQRVNRLAGFRGLGFDKGATFTPEVQQQMAQSDPLQQYAATELQHTDIQTAPAAVLSTQEGLDLALQGAFGPQWQEIASDPLTTQGVIENRIIEKPAGTAIEQFSEQFDEAFGDAVPYVATALVTYGASTLLTPAAGAGEAAASAGEVTAAESGAITAEQAATVDFAASAEAANQAAIAEAISTSAYTAPTVTEIPFADVAPYGGFEAPAVAEASYADVIADIAAQLPDAAAIEPFGGFDATAVSEASYVDALAPIEPYGGFDSAAIESASLAEVGAPGAALTLPTASEGLLAAAVANGLLSEEAAQFLSEQTKSLGSEAGGVLGDIFDRLPAYLQNELMKLLAPRPPTLPAVSRPSTAPAVNAAGFAGMSNGAKIALALAAGAMVAIPLRKAMRKKRR